MISLFHVYSRRSSQQNIQEQAAWGLGNIVGDSRENRDFALSSGILDPLLAIVEKVISFSSLCDVFSPLMSQNENQSLTHYAGWALSNLCRRHPCPFSQLKRALPALAVLIHSPDETTLVDACWALSHLTDGTLSSSFISFPNTVFSHV